MNMLQTIVPKSDQLNADDLIGQSMTIRVTEVRFKAGDDQPVAIHFDGDAGKPYKPCKSMRRVLVQAWGADANNYVGRSMSLCRDPKVQWAGQAVGGIRITHLSHIEQSLTMALTATRGSRKPYTVDVLSVAPSGPATQPPTVAEYEKCDGPGYKLLEARRKEHYSRLTKQQNAELEAAKKSAFERLSAAATRPAATSVVSEQKAGTVDHETWIGTLKGQSDPAQLEKSWAEYLDQCASASVDTHPDAEDAYKAVSKVLAKQ